MNVSSIGQGPGSVATLPGPQTSGETSLPSLRGSPQAAVPVVETSSRGPTSDGNVVRLAWFDMNGDGHIDNRSPLAGGDGTLIVPAHTAHPEYSHEVHHSGVQHTTATPRRVSAAPEHSSAGTSEHAKESTPAPAPVAVSNVTSDVQTRQAIDAYQRYGQPAASTTPARAVA